MIFIIDILFLIFLVSGLCAGGYAMYNLFTINNIVMNDDIFTLNSEVRDSLGNFEVRLSKIESNQIDHKEELRKLKQALKNLDYEE